MIREIAEENQESGRLNADVPSKRERIVLPLRNAFVAYGLSLIVLALMLGIRASLNPVLVGHIPYSLCYVAVVFAVWVGGLGPASAVIFIGFVVAERFFVPRENSMFFNGLENWIGLGSYMLVSCSVVLVTEGLRHEQRRRLAAVQETAEILDSVSNAFISIDKDWKLQYVNAAAESLIGRSKDELIGRDARELAESFLGSPRHRAFVTAMETRRRVELEDFFPGTGHWFEIHISPLEDGGLAAYYKDITARKHEDTKLRTKMQALEYRDRVASIAGGKRPRVSVDPEKYSPSDVHSDQDDLWSPW